MSYFLAAFMLQAYIVCTEETLDHCGYSSWVEFEPSRYPFNSKSDCITAATAFAKHYREQHKKTMTIVYTLPACPEYEHKLGPQAFEGSVTG
ncbi:hypothetical protein AB833_12180 [Chromatiales bacterium (ex Bugula neritina AB1)]|nr:hypothetical protein AB833_12180 [Chromatiales bacterium (ex Bugula neritina AB1)]